MIFMRDCPDLVESLLAEIKEATSTNKLNLNEFSHLIKYDDRDKRKF